MFGPWEASVVTLRKKTALPLGRYWAMNFGSVMSGLVALWEMVAMSASLRIGEMALPSPLIIVPMAATTAWSATYFRWLVAAWAGSYWPAAGVAVSRTASS